ncbi:MAG: VWA domain-containing protein [Planctomycetota bacterium]
MLPPSNEVWSWARPGLLLLAVAGPGAALLWLIGVARARSLLRRLADASLLDAIAPKVRLGVRAVRGIVIGASMVLLAVAAAGPRSDPESVEVEREGREICVVLDVSRSMLARDLSPNRLDRSKLWVRDLVADRPDARFGLIAFAGAPTVLSPLTHDHVFFDLALEEASATSVARGGTNLGDAIRHAMRLVFDASGETRPGTRDLILITDGEDQGSFPVEAAAEAGRLGVRVITLGIGGDGSMIPDQAGGVITENGSPVRTQLDAATLEQIASATPGGVFLNVGDGTIRLDRVYADLTSGDASASFESAETTVWRERYLVALLPAIVLLVLERLLRDVGRTPA